MTRARRERKEGRGTDDERGEDVDSVGGEEREND